MFGIKKINYLFQLKASDNIHMIDIYETSQLINYVIAVNKQLKEKNEQGWLYIEKIKQFKKRDMTIFGLKLVLPVEESASYFDEKLAPFYRKKPVPFDPPFLEEKKKESSLDQSSLTIQDLPPDMADLMAAGEEFLSEASHEVEGMEIHEEVEKESFSSPIQPELEGLKQAVERLEAERARLYAANSELQRKIDSQAVTSATVPPVALPSQDYSVVLSQLIEKETQQLEEDIKQMDKRSLISEDVHRQMMEAKEEKLRTEIGLLEAKKATSIAKEREQYEQRLKEIEGSYQAEKAEREATIQQEFSDKTSQEIAKEYERQTEALNMYIQTRKEELKQLQESLSERVDKRYDSLLNAIQSGEG